MMLVVLIAEYMWKVKIPEKIRIYMWLCNTPATSGLAVVTPDSPPRIID
jgi:hypothetical protein